MLYGRFPLSTYPTLGVEKFGLLAKLEVENILACAIICHGAKEIAGFHLLSLMYNDRGEVAIDRDVASVAHEHILHATKGKDGRNLSIKDGTGTSTLATHVVDALAVEHHMAVA